MAADTRLLWWADLGVHMSDEFDTLGVEATEVRPDSAGRNVLIAVIGLVLAVAALIPLTWGAIWVGSIVYAGVWRSSRAARRRPRCRRLGTATGRHVVPMPAGIG